MNNNKKRPRTNDANDVSSSQVCSGEIPTGSSEGLERDPQVLRPPSCSRRDRTDETGSTTTSAHDSPSMAAEKQPHRPAPLQVSDKILTDQLRKIFNVGTHLAITRPDPSNLLFDIVPSSIIPSNNENFLTYDSDSKRFVLDTNQLLSQVSSANSSIVDIQKTNKQLIITPSTNIVSNVIVTGNGLDVARTADNEITINSSPNLDNLTDVNLQNRQNLDLFYYNSSENKWLPTSIIDFVDADASSNIVITRNTQNNKLVLTVPPPPDQFKIFNFNQVCNVGDLLSSDILQLKVTQLGKPKPSTDETKTNLSVLNMSFLNDDLLFNFDANKTLVKNSEGAVLRWSSIVKDAIYTLVQDLGFVSVELDEYGILNGVNYPGVVFDESCMKTCNTAMNYDGDFTLSWSGSLPVLSSMDTINQENIIFNTSGSSTISRICLGRSSDKYACLLFTISDNDNIAESFQIPFTNSTTEPIILTIRVSETSSLRAKLSFFINGDLVSTSYSYYSNKSIGVGGDLFINKKLSTNNPSPSGRNVLANFSCFKRALTDREIILLAAYYNLFFNLNLQIDNDNTFLQLLFSGDEQTNEITSGKMSSMTNVSGVNTGPYENLKLKTLSGQTQTTWPAVLTSVDSWTNWPYRVVFENNNYLTLDLTTSLILSPQFSLLTGLVWTKQNALSDGYFSVLSFKNTDNYKQMDILINLHSTSVLNLQLATTTSANITSIQSFDALNFIKPMVNKELLISVVFKTAQSVNIIVYNAADLSDFIVYDYELPESVNFNRLTVGGNYEETTGNNKFAMSFIEVYNGTVGNNVVLRRFKEKQQVLNIVGVNF